jgi:hypothetical protein
MPLLISFYLTMIPCILSRSIASEKRSFVVGAMNSLMETVVIGKPTDGSKRLCLHFWSPQASDAHPLIVSCRTGCSGTVRNYRTQNICLDWLHFSIDKCVRSKSNGLFQNGYHSTRTIAWSRSVSFLIESFVLVNSNTRCAFLSVA